MDLNSLTGTSIALVLLYLQLALAVSAFTELIAAVFDLRGKDLGRWLRENLTGPIGQAAAKHPLVRGARVWRLGTGWKEAAPAWIDPEAFAQAILAARPTDAAPGSPTPTVTTEGMLAHATKEELERWFRTSMEHVGAEYARWARQVNFAVALLLAFALNADTARIIREGPANDAAQAALEARAQHILTAGDAADADVGHAVQALRQDPVIGWSDAQRKEMTTWDDPARLAGRWALKLLGLFATALATSLGAPFWFDLLKKFVGAPASAPPEPAKK